MANKTINDLTLLTSVASADFIPYWDTSGAVTRKATLTDIFAVLLAQANTFTGGQTIAYTSIGAVGLQITQPAGATQFGLRISDSVGARVAFQFISGGNRQYFYDVDIGSGAAGNSVRIGRNTNATNGAGFVAMVARGGTEYRIWPDNAGNARIHTADPTNANDLAGTVIGTQTSMADAKNLLGEVGDPREALQAIIDVAKHGLRRFNYKSGSFNDQEFEGVVTDFAHRYGMDRDAEHPAGKSLNEIQLFGDLIRAVAYLAEKIGLTEDDHG